MLELGELKRQLYCLSYCYGLTGFSAGDSSTAHDIGQDHRHLGAQLGWDSQHGLLLCLAPWQDISGMLAQLRQLGLFLSIWLLHNLSNRVSGPLMHWGSQCIPGPQKHRSGSCQGFLRLRPTTGTSSIFCWLRQDTSHPRFSVEQDQTRTWIWGGVIHWEPSSESSYHTSLAASSSLKTQ